MEVTDEASCHDGTQSSCWEAAALSWTILNKAIITMVMGFLMSAAGILLFALRSPGGADPSRSVASACLSVGLMFVVVGLVWIPVLKEKHKRDRLSQGLE